MAKIHHNDFQDTINDLIQDASKKGVVHLFTDGDELTGRTLQISGKELINFGTCGYLGLEMEPELKNGAIDFTQRFGTQFSVSRTYVTAGTNKDLETYLQEMYGYPVIVSSSTSNAHIAIIPTIMRDGSAIILDQQVHMSVQTAAQLTRSRGVPIEMIRHSNLEMLERRVKELQGKYDKIWYLIDGVYSMFGDVAPIKEILALTEKYESLHVYIDDAHGMSWYGKNGCGYIFDTVGMHPKMVLVTTLAKGFGVTGGLAIFPDQGTYEKVKIFGGPLTYSHPLAPPLLGAAIASAQIHLSPKIYKLQEELKLRIEHCNRLLELHSLPVISNPQTPICFIGMGHPRVGYNMVKRLLDDSFYINLGLFPAVPVKNTGVRFTLTRHQKLEDIEALVDAMAYHFPRALEEEGRTENEVWRMFHLPYAEKDMNGLPKPKIKNLEVQHELTIKKINKNEWNSLMANEGVFTHDSLATFEKAFTGNDKLEDNWKFHYFLIRDQFNKPILATFLTLSLIKDDFLSPFSISSQVEEKRAADPYFLTSKTIMMGSLLTEGCHLFLDKGHPECDKAMALLLEEIVLIQESSRASNIIFRDFNEDVEYFSKFLIKEGFLKIQMPHANIVPEKITALSEEEYLKNLGSKRRKHLKLDVYQHMHNFDIQFSDKLTEYEADIFYELYLQVKSRNLSINYFPYPQKLFQTLANAKGWEFIKVYFRNENGEINEKPVAIGACHKETENYTPLVLGMDYTYVYNYKLYKQVLYQVVKRARQLGKKKIFFGFSADTEKRKLGAEQIPRVAYLQAKDNFNFEFIESMAVV